MHKMPTNDVVKPMDLPTAPVPVNSVDPSLLPCGIPGLDAASMSQLLLAQLCTGMTVPATTTSITTAAPLIFPFSVDDQQQFMLGLYKLLASSLYWSAFEKLIADSLPLLGSVTPPTAPAPLIVEEPALTANPLAFHSLLNTRSATSTTPSVNSLASSSSASCSPDIPMNLSKSSPQTKQPQPVFEARRLSTESSMQGETEANSNLPRISQWLQNTFGDQMKPVFPDINADSSPILAPGFPVTASFDGSSTVCSDEDETRADDRPSHASLPISQRHSNPFHLRRSPKRVHRLWQFLWTLLEDPKYNPSIIRWVDKEAKMFELTKSSVVANLWGAQKQKPGMSYENLGRSLRYYYSRKILKKVSGQRLVYQFLPTEALLACEKSQVA